jgi:ribosome-binding factor A
MTIKQERAAQLIKEIMGNLLMFEVTDPALEAVTVTEVRIDRELEYADIYVQSRDDKDEVMAGLERAGGFLRRELAARTSFRRAPVLHFHWDATIEHVERIDELLNSLHIEPEAENNQDNHDDGLGESE